MPGWRARKLCPQLMFVGGHFQDYQRLGDAVIKVLNDFTPLVERISIDEAFLPMSRVAPISSVSQPKLQPRSGAECGPRLRCASHIVAQLNTDHPESRG